MDCLHATDKQHVSNWQPPISGQQTESVPPKDKYSVASHAFNSMYTCSYWFYEAASMQKHDVQVHVTIILVATIADPLMCK